MPHDYAITFACYNSVKYTKACIESFIETGTPMDRLVVVDNGSTDQTREYLQGLNLGGRIYNKGNLGCGVAWNQGIIPIAVKNNNNFLKISFIQGRKLFQFPI